jgi:hypothetical protein
MALWPANRRDGLGFNPYLYVGLISLYDYVPSNGARYNVNLNEYYRRHSAVPDGYNTGGAVVMPIKPGGMSSSQARITVSGAGTALSASVMTGNGNISVTGAGAVSLVVSMTGNGNLSVTGAGNLALTIGLAGNGNISITGDGSLSMRVPIAGNGNISLTGAADLRGILTMQGSWGGAAALSAEGLANAVWSALATSNNTPGTMGAKVNASGGASDPWSVTLEGTYTAADLMRIMTAVLAGTATGTNQPGVTKFKSLDGTKDRVTSTQTEGARTTTALDGA